jgi:hypothetical protein
LLLGFDGCRGRTRHHRLFAFFQFLDAQQADLFRSPAAADMGNCNVVRNTIGPGSQGAALVEFSKAAPKRDMNFLQKIATIFGAGFIGAR